MISIAFPPVAAVVLAGLLAACANAPDETGTQDKVGTPDEAGAPYDGVYRPTALQEKVDRSFSDIPIEADFGTARHRLTELRVNGCEEGRECDWRNPDGVRHYFWADSPDSIHMVVKTVRTSEFEGRPIPALGIGMARDRAEVIARVRRFLPDAKLECSDGTDAIGDGCEAFLGPGWVSVTFDARGVLSEVRFDGYHFT